MLTIGRLAAIAHVTRDTLRYYEREGLIDPPDKSAAGYRLYGKNEIARLRFIRQAQACGFTLVEIRTLLSLRSATSACCGDVRAVAIEKKEQLQAKIKTMRAMSRVLDQLIADCTDSDQPVDACPILSAFDGAEVK